MPIIKCTGIEFSKHANYESTLSFVQNFDGKPEERKTFKLGLKHAKLTTALRGCKMARTSLEMVENVTFVGDVVIATFNGKHCKHQNECSQLVCSTYIRSNTIELAASEHSGIFITEKYPRRARRGRNGNL